jgi:hypothetical protein
MSGTLDVRHAGALVGDDRIVVPVRDAISSAEPLVRR